MWEGSPPGPVVALPLCWVWQPAGTLVRLVPSVRRRERHCACWYSRTETRWGTYWWHSHQFLCEKHNWIGQVHVPVWFHLHLQTWPTRNRYFNEATDSMNHEYHTYMLYGVHLPSSSVFTIHSPTTANLSVPNVRQLTKTPPSLICLP